MQVTQNEDGFCISVAATSQAEAEAALSRRIHAVRAWLHHGVPWMLHDTLASKTILQLYHLLENSGTNIVGRMVEAVFTSDLTSLSLDFNQFMMFRDSLRANSHLLAGLVRLHLNFGSLHFFRSIMTNGETDIIKILEGLHNLKYLTVNECQCTSKVLKCLVNNCPLFEEVILNPINDVDDDAIDMLTQLRNLRNITLTTLRCGSIESLLACENIEQISIILNSTDLILQELTKLDEKNSDKKFNLKTYRSNNNTLEELRLIFRRCPSIHTLSVQKSPSEGQSNIMAITDLRTLRHLTLKGYSFYRDGVSDALQAVGGNLEHLHLVRAEQMGLNALVDISQTCPNLKSLSLDHWSFKDETTSHRAPKTPPFRSLKNLTLDMTSSYHCQERPLELLTRVTHKFNKLHDAADFLLANCLNVEYVEFDRTFVLTEDLMLHILDSNPLTFLKSLTIVQYDKTPRTLSELTPLVLDRIVRNCIHCPEIIQTLAKRSITSF